jgi:hypothetical protein
MVKDLLGDAPPAHLWLDVHPLHISGRVVQLAQRAAPEGASLRPRHHERPDSRREMLRLEVRPKSFFSRVAAGQVRVECRDQPACIG